MVNAETHNLSECWKDVAESVHSLVDIYVNTASVNEHDRCIYFFAIQHPWYKDASQKLKLMFFTIIIGIFWPFKEAENIGSFYD